MQIVSFFLSFQESNVLYGGGNGFGNNLHTCGVFVDFSKAFHCRLYDLAKHGIRETPLIIVTFQIGRFQPISRDTNNNRETYDFWWTNKRR